MSYSFFSPLFLFLFLFCDIYFSFMLFVFQILVKCNSSWDVGGWVDNHAKYINGNELDWMVMLSFHIENYSDLDDLWQVHLVIAILFFSFCFLFKWDLIRICQPYYTGFQVFYQFNWDTQNIYAQFGFFFFQYERSEPIHFFFEVIY